LFFLIIIGSAIFVSAFVVHVRRRAFERAFTTVVEQERQRRAAVRRLSRGTRSFSRSRSLNFRGTTGSRISQTSETLHDLTEKPNATSTSSNFDHSGASGEHDQSQDQNQNQSQDHDQISSHPTATDPRENLRTPVDLGLSETNDETHISFSPETVFHVTSNDGERGRSSQRHRVFSMQSSGAHSTASFQSSIPGDQQNRQALGMENGSAGLSTTSLSVARNSQFHGLTGADRERIGGVEYRGLRFLAVLVPLYFALWQFFGCIGLGAYVAYNRPSIPAENGLNPWYDPPYLSQWPQLFCSWRSHLVISFRSSWKQSESGGLAINLEKRYLTFHGWLC
jgi:hypothetical protein